MISAELSSAGNMGLPLQTTKWLRPLFAPRTLHVSQGLFEGGGGGNRTSLHTEFFFLLFFWGGEGGKSDEPFLRFRRWYPHNVLFQIVANKWKCERTRNTRSNCSFRTEYGATLWRKLTLHTCSYLVCLTLNPGLQHGILGHRQVWWTKDGHLM